MNVFLGGKVLDWLKNVSAIFVYVYEIYATTDLVLFCFVLGRFIGLMSRVFANGPGDLGSIQGRVIPKTLKMVLDTSLLNTQQYKVRIKGKVEQSRERISALPNISV